MLHKLAFQSIRPFKIAPLVFPAFSSCVPVYAQGLTGQLSGSVLDQNGKTVQSLDLDSLYTNEFLS